MPKPRYTHEQKLAAAEHFASNRTTLTQACRAMGYPTRYVLRQWISEIRPELLEKPCAGKKSRVRCTQEQKQAAVEAMLVDGVPDYKVAAQYGVSRAALYKWKQQLLGKDCIASMEKKQHDIPSNASKTELESEIANLQAQIHRLQMERDALEKATELLKKAGGINLTHLKNAEKAEVIDALRHMYRLKELIQLFNISKSSYFFQKKRLQREDPYLKFRIRIHQIFDEASQCYGYRRIHAVLKREGYIISEKVVRRIMREDNLIVPISRRKKYSSYMGEISPAVENIIDRNFHTDAPNEKWLTDITEFGLPAGKVYLSPIVDCFDGMAVSWTIGTAPNAELANTMLDAAIRNLKEEEHPIVHSDRGGHYRWPGWIKRMDEAGLTRSMSKKGC